MTDVFEIVNKDLLGRTGKLYTPHGIVETPAVMPVINPNLRLIEPKELRRYGAQMLITNSYIIYKSERWHEEALKNGLHSMLGFDGPIMTDSGSFQLSVYGSMEVTNARSSLSSGTSALTSACPWISRHHRTCR